MPVVSIASMGGERGRRKQTVKGEDVLQDESKLDSCISALADSSLEMPGRKPELHCGL